MKRLLRLIAIMLLVSLPVTAQAEPLQDYEEARDIYDTALACMAAYSNRLGSLGFSRLEQEGWKVQHFAIEQDATQAKFLLLQQTDPVTGKVRVMLAVAGTETTRDIKADLKYGQVYFAGRNFAESAAKAEEKDLDHTFPKVHRGFNDVTQLALTADILEGPGEDYVTEHLLSHPEHELLLTGHSLGGAVATLYAAKLISLGVRPEQVKVITFGAPAVGNAAFADLVKDRLNLTRVTVSGDQVTSVLQSLTGSYVQFGNHASWEAPSNIVMHPHHIPVYLNMAVKNFYDKRWLAVRAGAVSVPMQTPPQGPRVYVAPVANSLSADLREEFAYMRETLWEDYRAMFPGYIFAEGDDDLNTSLAKAAAAGCEWLVAAEIESRPSKNEEGVFFVSLNQVIYRVKDRTPVSIYGSSDSTERATPIGAFISSVRAMRSENLFRLQQGG